jgi:hypothetical protein
MGATLWPQCGHLLGTRRRGSASGLDRSRCGQGLCWRLAVVVEVPADGCAVDAVLLSEGGRAHAGGMIGEDGLVVDALSGWHRFLHGGDGEFAVGEFFEPADLQAHCRGGISGA